MSRIRRGWAADEEELGAAAGNRELMRFPLYGAVATILCASSCSARAST